MNKPTQRTVLAGIVQQAKDAGIKIRWCDDDVVVLGIAADGETQVTDQPIPGEGGEEGRGEKGTDESAGS